ncbi:TIGR01440 family protein [Paenibacillus thermotolerans]|uniref:TIGR01440 family protein n=1 Tax=Paenibacillus thermotolerans TaxID=3027807 RepID=UPI002367529B|nr:MULTISPECIES: TIGR01440 family protein [unclassified Paenibacillus]
MAYDIYTIAKEVAQAGGIKTGQLVVAGVSTSEVLGQRIGSHGTSEVASALFAGLQRFQEEIGCYVAYQCCEHLNRALVIEREAAEKYGFEPVSVVPVPKAGGAMASWAHRHLDDAVIVEEIRAHAGIDVGETLIGMHLRRVAVPFRPSIRFVGNARVNAAFTRPKLIGGARAVYTLPQEGMEPVPAATATPETGTLTMEDM